eukprot:tig00020563_g11294.t1
MAFSLFDFHFFFAGPLVFYVLGAWALMAPYWFENFITPGLDEKVFVGDPLNELAVQLYGISLILGAAIFYIVLRHATTVGDSRIAALLLGIPCALGALGKIIVYGLFHNKHNPVFAFGPMLYLVPHILTLLLAALSAWRFWGQQGAQPAAAAPRKKLDIFAIVGFGFSLLWLLFFTVALFWPVQFNKWVAPGFVGTTAEGLYSLPATVALLRLAAVVFIATNLAKGARLVIIGLARADEATNLRCMAASFAGVVAMIWVYGDFVRRYAAPTLASAPALVFVALCGELLLNVVALLKAGPAATAAAPAGAAAPYYYGPRV